jgi:hypothetical protein
MKKTTFALIILGAAFFMIGADNIPATEVNEVSNPKKKCLGYTVVEAGLGVDCNGDMVKLVKRNGFYELATSDNSHEE